MTREPKCIQWKRRGAEKVAAQLSGLSPDQELKFWQEATKRLKLIQVEEREKRRQQLVGA